MRLYHLAVRRQTWHLGRRRYVDADPVTYTRMTSSPLPHRDAEVVVSKFAPETQARMLFVEASVAELLDDLRELSPRRALRVVFELLDAALLAGDFGFVDEVLAAVRPDDLDVTVALGFLAITLPARQRMKERAGCCARVRAWLAETRPLDVESLMKGLE